MTETRTPPGAWRTASGPIGLDEPLYLGILNLTPDSFSDGGRFLEPARALEQARSLVAQGAGALDLGAESTRPGAAPVTPEEEWARLEPVLPPLRRAFPRLPLSLDTRHAEVAARALALGVAAINDVTGFRDPALLGVVRDSGCGLIAMRSRLEGEDLVMPPYGGPGITSLPQAVRELEEVRDRVLGAGIHPERILLDPGFGFGTTFSDDLALWEALPSLPGVLHWPRERFCIAISRKRFLAWRAGSPGLAPLERDPPGARAHREAARAGFRVFRTHAVTQPILRPAEPGDAAALAQIQVASWRAAYQDILPEATLASLSLERLRASFAQSLSGAAPPFRIWILEARGRLLGFAVAGACREPEAREAGEIHAIYLLREAWGQGLGQALLERALAGLAQDGFRRAVLWVLERNTRARAFYAACGWEPQGTSRTEWQDGIALRTVAYRRSLEPMEPLPPGL